MNEKQVVLSARLQMLADMVTPKSRVADVGCDHGFLSIYLVQQKISPFILAMDVRSGPLAAAKEHIAACRLERYIQVRLSDGLKAMEAGEADTLVCAGMGGPLMQRILTDSKEKAHAFRELILQPQSEIGKFRAFLRREGYLFLQENAVYEDGKFYFAMKVCYDSGKGCADGISSEELALRDEFGPMLLQRKNPVLKEYLEFRRGVLEQIEKTLSDEATDRAAARLREVSMEREQVNRALLQYI